MGQIVTVVYLDEKSNTYGGREYTYRTKLPLKRYMKVIAPTYDGEKKALVWETGLPESVIQPEWADAVKWISKLDR